MGRRVSRRAFAALAATLLLLSWCSGCKRSPELEPVVDLVQAFPAAELSAERAVVDFGTSEGGSFLASGWSWREKSRDQTTFVWSSGRQSVLEFFVAEPRDLQVRMRCLAYPFKGGAPQRLAIAVAGGRIAELELSGDWREYTFSIPSRALAVGVNQMTFDYSRIAGESGEEKAERPLGVAFDWLHFEVPRGISSRAFVEPGLLALAAGSRLDYFFEAPAGALFAVEDLDFSDSNGAKLTIEVERDGGSDDVLAELQRDGRRRRWPLGREGGVFRLRLELVKREDGGSEASVVMSKPQILAPGPSLGSGPSPESGSGAESRRFAVGHQPNVILYVVDTLRADHLGAYGYTESGSPEIDRFASEGVTFDAAVAQAPWTLPAMASIFTGLSPRTHGANSKESQLPADVMTLAGVLRESGYTTGAVVANGFVSQAFGFDRGFDGFEFLSSLDTRAEELLAKAGGWLDTVDDRRPVFLFLHAIDPHDSYDPPGEFLPRETTHSGGEKVGTRTAMKALKKSSKSPEPELLERLLTLYDGEIAYTDWAFGRFVDELRQRGLYESSLIVFVSDHGEEFFDHGGWLHGHSLHSELIDVPLILRFPNGRHGGARVDAPVQHVDLMPTVVEYLGLEAPYGLEGRSLLRHLGEVTASGRAGDPEPVFSYLENRWVSIVTSDWKLIARPVGGRLRRRALYDRMRDPQERRDLTRERPVLAGFLTTKIREQLQAQRRQVTSATAIIDPEMEQHLKALGYLD
jgi:arylsulfatase A-like enzyme